MKKLLNFIKNIISRFNIIPDIILENLALRQQLAVMKQYTKRPKIRIRDRIFWVILSHFWDKWREPLIIVKPDTVVSWHKKGFKLFWRWKSRSRNPGRTPVNSEIRNLIIQMANANPLWGAPRIHGELLKLGINISERTVSSIMPKRPPKPPSQTWKTFLKNHLPDIAAIDFFTVPTARFRILFVLVIIKHCRRKLIHFNTTYNPTKEWTTQQIIEAFPWDTAPKYLLRDRDSIYGAIFRSRVNNMKIKEVLIATRSPWQNPYVERLIGSIRRECLNHMIVLNDRHLRRILSSYFDYYNRDRTHYNLEKDTPLERNCQPRPNKNSRLLKLPRVGGLHHRYEWRKAA